MPDVFGSPDPAALERAAHGLRGVLSTFCTRSATAFAERIEAMGQSGDLNPGHEVLSDLERELERLEP